MRVGAIDIGSNSIRLLVADVMAGDAQSLTTVSRAGEPCRLGKGLDSSGSVDPAIADRAAELAEEFVRRARSLGAQHIVAGATAALRKAGNGEQVAARIAERIGLTVRILSGEDEARLVYASVVLGLKEAARRSACVVFDLGGGSTEVVSGLGPEPGRWTSLPFGAVSLTERFIRSNPVSQAEMDALIAEVRTHLMHECALMPQAAPLFAGVGGTVTVLASLDRGISVYEPSLLEGWTIASDRLQQLTDRVARSTEDERSHWPILGRGRSDIVVAGALVIRALADRFQPQGMLCSTQGLRYGLARLAASEVERGAANGGPFPATPDASAARDTSAS
jgi:exopolyphosphatase / guanosine-5'-triphosphate,3'-diphosphate pyrophosphatase